MEGNNPCPWHKQTATAGRWRSCAGLFAVSFVLSLTRRLEKRKVWGVYPVKKRGKSWETGSQNYLVFVFLSPFLWRIPFLLWEGLVEFDVLFWQKNPCVIAMDKFLMVFWESTGKLQLWCNYKTHFIMQWEGNKATSSALNEYLIYFQIFNRATVW